jgi:sigma-B regulation protein RsbU (phosphoserine phosphatase)
MTVPVDTRVPLSRDDLEDILAVTRRLAAPFDLSTMLGEVAGAARRVLHAERSSVWLVDAAAGELVMEVSSDIGHVRIPITKGLVGACVRERCTINVPDCYADPRFDASVDRASGYRTRCSLTLPLVDHLGEVIGAMQVLNRLDGVFEPEQQTLAEALAAQCAMALARARMMQGLIEAERMRRELSLARDVQRSSLPASLPQVVGYATYAMSMPAEQTGGDTYDLGLLPQGLLVVLGDAAGHGIAPALAVVQMQAMLRVAFGLGCDLETAFRQVNDRLAASLPDSRFITAFVGIVDPATHRLRFLSAGQSPIVVHRASTRRFDVYGPTSFPLGAMPIVRLRPAIEVILEEGDLLALLSDGVYETENAEGETFGRARVEALLEEHRDAALDAIAEAVLGALGDFAPDLPQADDITMVLLRRDLGA